MLNRSTIRYDRMQIPKLVFIGGLIRTAVETLLKGMAFKSNLILYEHPIHIYANNQKQLSTSINTIRTYHLILP